MQHTFTVKYPNGDTDTWPEYFDTDDSFVAEQNM